MRCSLVFLSLLSISSALPAEPLAAQDLAPKLLETVTELNTAVADLTTNVNKFDGSLLGLLPQALAVVGAQTKVDLTVLKATHIAERSSNFTAQESSSIVSSLANGIGPIQASLDALKAKYPVFRKTLTSPIALLSLKTLKTHTDNLIAALKAKVTADNAGLLDLGKGILDQAFDNAIAVYSA